MLRRSRLVGVFALACVVLAGCGGPINGSAAGQQQSVDERATNPEATLTVALRRPTPNLDPAITPTTSDEPQVDLFYDKLFRMSPDGVAEPELAEAYQFTADGLVLTIRSGVTFHDGTKLDAEAVKANIERAKTIDGSGVRGDLAPITGIEVTGPNTVLLRTAQRDVTLPAVLSTRAGAMVSPAAFSDPGLAQRPVGAGPFRMVENRQSSRMVLERFPDYWRPDVARVARLEIVFLPDAVARLNAVRSGQVAAAEIDVDQIAETRAAGLRVASASLQSTACLQVSSDTVPAFADERVRQAMSLAIDREAIVAGVLQGQGRPTAQFFPEGSIAHDPNTPSTVPVDVERAKALLAEAGFPNGFSLETYTGTTPSQTEVEAIAGSLAKVGITMKVTPLVGNESIVRVWNRKTGQSLTAPCNTQVDPALALGYFLPGNLRNPSSLVNERVVELHRQALTEQDPGKRRAVLQQISAELFAHPLNIIPLYTRVGAFALSADVVGLEYPSSGLYEFRGVGIAAR